MYKSILTFLSLLFLGALTTKAGISSGSLTVTIYPAAVVSAGAQWQVDGGPLQNSGVTVANVPPGTHTISFTAVAEWTSPSNQTVTVISNSTTTATGTYTDEFTYTTNIDGTLTIISYTGTNGVVTIPSAFNSLPVTGLGNGSSAVFPNFGITNVTIPNSITHIAASAFEYCYNLASIAIPDSVTNVGVEAFISCSALSNLTIGANVTTIGQEAFYGCSELSSVTIPGSVTNMGAAVFDGSGLTNLIILNGVPAIGSFWFEDCPYLVEVTIPSSVTSIGQNAFTYCSSLPGVTIPNSVTNIGSEAFYGNSLLTNIVIGTNVNTIGNSAFESCTSLPSISIPASVTNLGPNVFSGCVDLTAINVDSNNVVYSSVAGVLFDQAGDILLQYPFAKTGAYSIAATVKNISAQSFYNCLGITSVSIPGTVTNIPTQAFEECYNLGSVTIASGVLAIGEEAFDSCESLGSITIPGSVNSIGDYAFDYCLGLSNVTLSSGIGSIGSFAFEYCDQLTNLFIPSTITNIGVDAFYESGLVSVTLANGIPNITTGAFEDCQDLASITIPGSVTNIGASAFYGSGITTLVIGNNVTGIGAGAFDDCYYLTSVTIPGSVGIIATEAFYDCGSLTNVIVSNGVTSIGDDAFASCARLENISIPDSVTNIGVKAFYSTGLLSVTIPVNVASIGDQAFNECYELTNISVVGSNSFYSSANGVLFDENQTILIQYPEGEVGLAYAVPDSVANVGDYAFYRDTNIVSVTMGLNVTNIETSAFDSCAKLASVSFSTNLLSIGEDAFEYCSSLTNIIIPNSVTNLGYGAFYVCSSLTNATIGSGVTGFGYYAFYDCPNLAVVYFEGNSPTVDSTTFGYDGIGDVYYIPGTSGWSNTFDGFPAAVLDAPNPNGALEVTIAPSGVVGLGARWQVDNGVVQHSGATVSNLTVGSHTISFNAVFGWTSPSNQNVTVTSNSIATATGVYIEQVQYEFTYSTNADGSLTITAYDGPGGPVNIPSNILGRLVTEIGASAFYDSAVTSVTVPSSVARLGSAAFELCTELTNAIIEGGITNMGSAVFDDCNALQSVILSNGITTIGASTFEYCYDLGSIEIPGSVTSIGADAFYDCGGLTNIFIGGGLATIGDNAFAVCYDLGNVYFEGNAPISDTTLFDYDTFANLTVYYVSGASGWSSTYENVRTALWNGAYTYTTNAGAITITGYYGDGGAIVIPSLINGLPVTSIATNAFSGISDLVSITIPAGVTNLGADAFYDSTNLTGVYFQGNAPGSGANVFTLDPNATIYYLPGANGWGSSFDGNPTSEVLPFTYTTNYAVNNGVTNLSLNISGYTGSGGAVTIPTNVNGLTVTSIGSYAFESVNAVTSMFIPGTVTNIGENAFYECVGLTNIIIGNGAASIGEQAFYYCPNLVAITIPASVSSLGYYVLGDCYDLTSVYFEGNAPAANSTLFEDDTTGNITVYYPSGAAGWGSTYEGARTEGLLEFTYTTNAGAITITGYNGFGADVTIPGAINGLPVTAIAPNAFSANTNLTSIIIPASVTNVGMDAFYDSPNLTGIYFDGNAPALGGNVFTFDNNATVYYEQGSSGWGSTFGGLPAQAENAPLAFSSLVAGTSNLLGYWPFTLASQANSTVNGYTGTFVANAFVGPAGSGPNLQNLSNNTALLLDGNGSYVNTSLVGGLDTDQGSIIGWFQITNLPSTAGHYFTIAGESQGGNDFDLQINTDNKIHFYTDQGNSTVVNNALTTNDFGVWHFVAATFTSSSARTLYLDGSLVAASVPGSHNAGGSGTFAIGASDVFSGRYFEGALADIAVFNRQLTVTEVSNLYASAIVAASPPGVPVINFDSLNTSGPAPVTGGTLAAYLAQYGVTILTNSPDTSVAVENQANLASGGFVIAPSTPNVLTQIGSNGPVDFTIGFSNLLSQFSFTRPELVANPSVSHPAWQAAAFDSLGILLDQVGEPQISSNTNVPAQTYTLGGGAIYSVEFSSDGSGFNTFNAMLLDNFVLTDGNPSDLPPSALIASPAPGQVFTSTTVPLTVETSPGSGTVTSVSYYNEGSLIGAASASPFNLNWTAAPNGSALLTAVVVNNSGLSATSAPVSVTVATGFAIVTPPASQTIGVGGQATFTVTTTETGVTYQWRANGINIPGASQATYTLNPAPASAAGNYTVVITSGGQSITSPVAVLTVLGPPTLGAPSLATNNGNIVLTVSANDSAPFYSQWQRNGNRIPGASNSFSAGPATISLTLPASPTNSGDYEVVVANAVASDESDVIDVTIGFGTAPTTTNINFASSLTLGILTNGSGVEGISSSASSAPANGPSFVAGKPAGGFLWYKWTANFTGVISLNTRGSTFDTLLGIYTGSNAASLTPVASDDDSGGFFTSLLSFNCTSGTTYYIVVAGYAGATGTMLLDFPGPVGGYSVGGAEPVITQQPANQIVQAGATVTLSVTATGATGYQWYFAEVPVANGNSASLVISNFPASAVGNYYVLVTNSVGSVQSTIATIQIASENQNGKPTTLLVDKFGDAVDLTTANTTSRFKPTDGGGDTGGFALSQAFSTVGATKEEGEPNHAGQPGGASYWYSYTATNNGTLQFNSTGSTFNTILAVYTGSGASFASLTTVGSGYTTNYLEEGQPTVVLSNVVAGSKYFIAVDGYQGASGSALINIVLNPGPIVVNTNTITNNTPSIAITSPTANYLTTSSNIIVKGTTKITTGTPAVSFVQVSVNGGLFGPATLAGTAWSTNVTLVPGANTIIAQSISVAGTNVNFASTPATRTIFYDVTKPVSTIKSILALLMIGNGKFSGAANQASLEIGKIYTVKAVPDTGWVFANWNSGTNTNNLSLLSESPSTAFDMSSNLILQATFVTNPFPSVAGVYNGLFYPAAGMSAASSGFFTATMAATGQGAYSGKLLVNGGAYPMTGTFDLDGDAEQIVKRSGGTSLTVDLHLELSGGNDQMTGTVSENAADGWSSDIVADRVVFNARSNPATDYAGKYTLIIPPGSGAPTNEPGGYGYATLASTLAGVVSLSGSLADNTAISQSVTVSKDGNIPLYVSLYSRKGLLMGWLSISGQTVTSTNVAWIKTNISKALYNEGFTNTDVTVLGSVYSATSEFTLTNATLTISNGSAAIGLTVTNVTIANNKLIVPGNEVTGAITPGTGVLTVTFKPAGGHSVTAKGVILQDAVGANAAGWFLGASQSGYFLLQQ